MFRIAVDVMLSVFAFCVLTCRAQPEQTPDTPNSDIKPREALDAYLDKRFQDAPLEPLLKTFKEANLTIADAESILRDGRASYGKAPQEPGKLTGGLKLDCDHVEHSVEYMIYVPHSYDPSKSWPLIVVGHGGSRERDIEFGKYALTHGGLNYWIEPADRNGFILLAPITDRGWGAIGNSIIISAISKVTREYRINPDRIYMTGHSMGGHLTWRSGLELGDRWGAISPMSGGYDYVKDHSVYNLFNVPGYATWGSRDIYGIDGANRSIKDWMLDHGFPWVNKECEGGHEIFKDEIPKVAQFFLDNSRNMYCQKVYAQAGRLEFNQPDPLAPGWKTDVKWIKDRPISTSVFRWIRFMPLPAGTPADKKRQTVWAVNEGNNKLELITQNVRKLKIYLHPRMVDFSKNIDVTANGKTVFDKMVAPNMKTMLELVREFDDRGRIFHAMIEVNIDTDGQPPEPTFEMTKATELK